MRPNTVVLLGFLSAIRISAQKCGCYTATIFKYPNNCPSGQCLASITSRIPPKDTSCPVTPTITSTQACPTSDECITQWDTTTLKTSSCLPLETGNPPVTTNPTTSPRPPTTNNNPTTRPPTGVTTASPKPSTSTAQPPTPSGCTNAEPTTPNIYNVPLSSPPDFIASGIIFNLASQVGTPAGYQQTFGDLPAATSATAYLGYQTVSKYEPQVCAAYCDSLSNCVSFNIYFERDPTYTPGTGCTNPPAGVNIKCSFWGVAIDATTATNIGQYRSAFQVVIAGSNGYTKGSTSA